MVSFLVLIFTSFQHGSHRDRLTEEIFFGKKQMIQKKDFLSEFSMKPWSLCGLETNIENRGDRSIEWLTVLLSMHRFTW